jgi:hypothetical protein
MPLTLIIVLLLLKPQDVPFFLEDLCHSIDSVALEEELNEARS